MNLFHCLICASWQLLWSLQQYYRGTHVRKYVFYTDNLWRHSSVIELMSLAHWWEKSRQNLICSSLFGDIYRVKSIICCHIIGHLTSFEITASPGWISGPFLQLFIAEIQHLPCWVFLININSFKICLRFVFVSLLVAVAVVVLVVVVVGFLFCFFKSMLIPLAAGRPWPKLLVSCWAAGLEEPLTQVTSCSRYNPYGKWFVKIENWSLVRRSRQKTRMGKSHWSSWWWKICHLRSSDHHG